MMSTPENKDLVAAVAAVAPILQANAAEIDRTAAFPRAGLQAIGKAGLYGLLVPAEYGGRGGTVQELVEVAQSLAARCLSTAMIWAMHCQQSDALVRFGSPSLRDEVLPRIARGELYLASITTEAGRGSNLLTGSAPLHSTSDNLSFDRAAPVVTGGLHAQGFLITMRATPDAPANHVSLVYANRDQIDVTTTGDWDTMGMRGTQSVALRVCGTVPPHQLVGAPGEFRTIALESMAPLGHIAWAACWLGTARRAFADLVGWLRRSERPKSIDVASELVAERLARIRIELELVSGYLHRVVDEVEGLWASGESLAGTQTQIHLNTLKVVAAERTFAAIDRMVQLAGLTVGYRTDGPLALERHFRDLRSASLNFANDRLLTATGALSLMDRTVRLA